MLGNPPREPAADSARRVPRRAALAWFRAIVRRLYAGLERPRQRRALATLSDAMLNDIGLTRRDAASESGKPFWR
jgi:uncharacterized protein YjiS (DUF1127 family)